MITENSSLTVGNAAARASEYIKTIPEYPEDRFASRGIVICAGGVRYLTNAWVLINILRQHGCTLPIEVWYLGEDEGDTQWIDLVRPLGVECIDACQHRIDHATLDSDSAAREVRHVGWASKSYAILHSRFREILFLDADNVPVMDPTYLLDCEQYQACGTVFWPDGPNMTADREAWKLFGVDYRDEQEVESGQLLIDKHRCWQAVNLANWYNEHADFYYRYIYGDKDTFRFAWHRLQQPFAMPRDLAMIPATICQHDFDDRRIFQHRCHDKWCMLGNRRCDGFIHEETCFELIEQLRQSWSPVIHLTRHLTDGDRAAMTRMSGQSFDLIHVGQNRWQVVLGEDATIEKGWSHQELFWWCEGDRIVLADSNGKKSCLLDAGDEQAWEGRSISDPETLVRLLHLEACVGCV